MIIVKLQGGLGNQMFQYAAGRALAIKRQTDLKLDISWYQEAAQSDGVGKRVYELAPLAIHEHIYHPTIVSRALLKLFGSKMYSDEGTPYTFHPEVLELPNYSRLFGYFQSERYFKDIRAILVKDFTLRAAAQGRNAALLKDIEANAEAVSLHVRRGDYVSSAVHSAFHGLTGLEYYQAAVRIIRQTVATPTFYVFSDDPEWCKANLKFDAPIVYVDNNAYGGEDMRLMRACRHNIIANSSFSWWGAWLNANPDKVVIAPKAWVADSSVATTDVVPESWQRV